jgi:EAL domain-containing protein (putative c-di-GMP-specific phosphodiesterase class I)
VRYHGDLAAFVAVSNIPDTRFTLQSVVTLQEFLHSYRPRLLVTALMLAFMGMLLYGALRSRFVRWQDLRYRIDVLLVEKNLVCMYQPILSLESQAVVGCEVLMRVRDGERLLYPDQVLPAIAERQLTWVLDQLVTQVAVAELARHLPALRDFKVAINFFPKNITLTKVHGAIGDALANNPHAGLRFNVEVIEQHYEGGVVQEIAALRRKNYLISVDDFGTGYSNLGSIKSISPDFLKIDKSFVFDMEEATIRSSLIPEIVHIARAVGAQLIAEGIENESQRALLQSLGVEFGQGYYFARPMEIAAFAHYLQNAGEA